MTPDELEVSGQALYGLRWQTAFARRANVDDRTVRRWLAGDRAIPGPVAALIEILLRHPDER